METGTKFSFALPRQSIFTDDRRRTLSGKPTWVDPVIAVFYEKYEMREILGKGACSTVRRCIELDTDIEFACKIIDLTLAESREQGRQMLLEIENELMILGACAGNPNIICLHDSYESSTFIFIVLELSKTGELFDYLTQFATLSEKRARRILMQLLGALAFLHSRNIVHRDIKTENILLDEQLNVKLSDFGFAVFCKNDYELKDLAGTPVYLAPEVVKISLSLQKEGYGRPVDIWACGVVMYMLLCGTSPFYHPKQQDMFQLIMDSRLAFDQPEWADIGDPCKDLIRKLLVVDPKKRLTAAAALAHPFIGETYTPMPVQPAPVIHATVAAAAAVPLMPLPEGQAVREFTRRPTVAELAAGGDMYAHPLVRKSINADAFQMYGHWIQKNNASQTIDQMFDNKPARRQSLR